MTSLSRAKTRSAYRFRSDGSMAAIEAFVPLIGRP
jgi:hypothetical protein